MHGAQVERAVELGHDLHGVMYWTLVDNFEWSFGFSMRVRWWSCAGMQPSPLVRMQQRLV
jgi:beta-glucosidase/6-phospho-beta-glucosidase/beta-galactosidase